MDDWLIDLVLQRTKGARRSSKMSPTMFYTTLSFKRKRKPVAISDFIRRDSHLDAYHGPLLLPSNSNVDIDWISERPMVYAVTSKATFEGLRHFLAVQT